MRARTAATIGGLAIAAAGFGIGIPLANASQPAPGGGGTCNNYGNSNIIVAPFCGATFAPLPAGSAPTTTTSRLTPITDTNRPTFNPGPPPTSIGNLTTRPGIPTFQPFPF